MALSVLSVEDRSRRDVGVGRGRGKAFLDARRFKQVA